MITLQQAYEIAKAATDKEGDVSHCTDLGNEYVFHFDPSLIGDEYDVVDKRTGKHNTMPAIPKNVTKVNAGKEIDIATLITD